MADETTTWARTQNTTELGDGKYRLEWKDETDTVLCSMEIGIDGDPALAMAQNYALMRRLNPELFVEPLDETMMPEESIVDEEVQA